MVTEERIRRALEKVAIFASDDPALLPIFERLERDLEEMQAHNSALDRARAMAAGQKEIGCSKAAA